jgi:glycosyltransferase involved in cell wall biosynthesis
MRVLSITQRYLPARGGAEEHLAQISRRLVARGHTVTVATTDALDIELFWDPTQRRTSLREECVDGVRVLRFPVRHLPAAPLAYAGLRRLLWVASRFRIPTAFAHHVAKLTPRIPQLHRWIGETRDRYDIVTSTTICFETLIDAAQRYASSRGTHESSRGRTHTPHVVTPLTHLGAGIAPGADALSRFYTMRHQVEAVLAADAIVAMTRAERDFYCGQGAGAGRIEALGSAVEPGAVLHGDGDAFRARHLLRDPIVACLSTLMYDKGTVHVVEAVRRLWAQGRRVELVLAGGVMRSFADFLAGLPVADRERIHLLGPVSDEEKRDLLAAADIFAMPSRTDSFGIVYLEAWLYGKPVIGARTWGVMDVIRDGADGLLVPFGDVDGLASALASLLDDPQRRRMLGEAGRAKVYAEHTWERKFPKIEELYLRLVEGRH